MKKTGAEKERDIELKTITETMIKAVIIIIEKSQSKEEAISEIKKLIE